MLETVTVLGALLGDMERYYGDGKFSSAHIFIRNQASAILKWITMLKRGVSQKKKRSLVVSYRDRRVDAYYGTAAPNNYTVCGSSLKELHASP